MKPIQSSVLRAAALLLCASGLASAQEIDVRISIKFILNGSGLHAPGAWSTAAGIQGVIDQTNEALMRWDRGYRYVITEYVDVAGATQFYDVTQPEFYQLENTAEANPVQYAWRTNAVNVYMVNSLTFAGGAAAIASNPPDAGYELMVMAAGSQPATGWAHELGHHFDLYHTFNNDGVADTLYDPESTCTSNFSCTTGGSAECCCTTKLTLLNAQGYNLTDYNNLLYNTMSYYGALDCVGLIVPPHDFDAILLTDGQLNRWSDATRKFLQLQGEVSGYTYFVDKAYAGSSTGYSTNPYKTVATGAGAAAGVPGGHIVLMRAGTYAENLTLTSPMTLRARLGAVTIGS